MHMITVRYDGQVAGAQHILVKLTDDSAEVDYFRQVAEVVPTVEDGSDECFKFLHSQEIVPERRDDTGRILRPGAADLHRDRYVTCRKVTGMEIREIAGTREALAAEVRRLSQEELGHVPMCAQCGQTRANGGCCSAHGHILLCHRCYRRTHFVEVCGSECASCAAEGLPPRRIEDENHLIRERAS